MENDSKNNVTKVSRFSFFDGFSVLARQRTTYIETASIMNFEAARKLSWYNGYINGNLFVVMKWETWWLSG